MRHTLGYIAARSPAIASAWEVLKDKPPTGFWLCLASPPPQDWLESASLDNLSRYRKAVPEKRPPLASIPIPVSAIVEPTPPPTPIMVPTSVIAETQVPVPVAESVPDSKAQPEDESDTNIPAPATPETL